MIRYSLGKNNEHIYPKSVEGVVWNSVLYHYTENLMIGETDDDVHADGKEVLILDSDEAEKLKQEYRSSRPKPEKSPKDMYLHRRPFGQNAE